MTQLFRVSQTFPLIDTEKQRDDMGLLEKYGLPLMYRNVLMKRRGVTTPGGFAG